MAQQGRLEYLRDKCVTGCWCLPVFFPPFYYSAHSKPSWWTLLLQKYSSFHTGGGGSGRVED